MPIILRETDTVADLAADKYCAVQANNSTMSAKQATSGGTAGVTAVTVTMDGDSAGHSLINFNSDTTEPNSASWEAGDWTVRIEITTANMNMDIIRIYVCRVNSAGVSQAEIWVDSTQTFVTTGVKTVTNAGGAQTANATDVIEVVFECANTFTMAASVGYKPSQNIDTPVNQGAAGGDGTDFPFAIFHSQPILTPIGVVPY